jgi:hypothetical protein
MQYLQLHYLSQGSLFCIDMRDNMVNQLTNIIVNSEIISIIFI